MKEGGAFGGYHPFVNFLYFAFVLVFSMFFMHPVCLVISLTAAFTYSVFLKGKKAIRFNLIYLLPMLLFAALVNPAFNHEGVTILTYLPSGNPLTIESIAYGIAAATMIVTVICWFSCYNEVMTSDKFIYLFGRVIPALSLILSMTMRFVPRFKAKMQVVVNGQRCLGRDVSNGSIFQRAKYGIKILSIMVTWALENAIETADSMKSRGYGLKGRTAFSIFSLDKRDKKALYTISISGLYILTGAIIGGLFWTYFPSMQGIRFSFYSITLFIAYLILCFTPVIIEIWEEKKWELTQSKI